MPTYDYDCRRYGTFSLYRPMSEYDLAQDCPGCGAASQRVLLQVSAIAGMDARKRAAIATNELSAHAPRRSPAGTLHGPTCGCCTGARARAAAADGMKSFSSRRPG